MSKPNYADEAAKLKGTEKKKKSVPKVKKCQYEGCPLKASSFVPERGGYSCNFHHSGQFHYDVSISIRNNLSSIQGYNRMIRWEPRDWVKNRNYLLNRKHCPMGENEPPSMYLINYFNWLTNKIQDEATVIVLKRLENQEAIESEL